MRFGTICRFFALTSFSYSVLGLYLYQLKPPWLYTITKLRTPVSEEYREQYRESAAISGWGKSGRGKIPVDWIILSRTFNITYIPQRLQVFKAVGISYTGS